MANGSLEELSQRATELSESATTLPNMLREAVTNKLTREDPIVRQRETALEDFLSAADTARAEFSPQQLGTVLSPTQQRALVSQRRAGAVAPLSSLNSILGARGQGLENIISSTGELLQGRASIAQQAFENALSQQQLALQRQKTTGGDRATQLLQSVATDASAGSTLEDVMKKYGAQVSPLEILRLYNLHSPFGQAQESPQELAERFGISAEDLPTAGGEEDDQTQKAINQIASLSKPAPFNLDEQFRFTSKKALAGQTLARVFEKGRLSDKDRDFYQGLLPGRFDPYFDSKLDAIEKSLRINQGLESPDNPRLQMPDGSVYEYDSISDPDYKADIQAGGAPLD